VDTARQCLALRPDRFSVFGYAHVPGFKKHQRKIDETVLPESAERQEQADAIARTLIEGGYRQIGMDHFALPDDAMARARQARVLRRNFQGYTTDDNDILIGFGASAIGQLPQGYVQNDPVLGSYCEAIREGRLATVRGYALQPDDRLRAAIIERLMCDFEVDLGAICERHGASAGVLLKSASRLNALAEDGVIILEGTRLRIPDEAHFLVRSVASAFDTHMDSQAKLHSRAV
jgi:oxygen-independent coproporphyrinogen-3 oxidase